MKFPNSPLKVLMQFLPLAMCIAVLNVSCTQVKEEKLEELLSTYASYGTFNGAVLVAQEGKLIYKKGFGLANREWDIPNQSDTRFRLASVSKQFTALLILQLVAENKLDLEAPISQYLPDYPASGEQISIHHLLSHSSGIPNYTSFPSYWKMMRQSTTPDELLRHFADSALRFTPGKYFEYSNSGYAVLGAIIEKLSGKSYEEVLQERIFIPLGMQHSGFDSHRKLIHNRASGYYKRGSSYDNANFIDPSLAYAAGGLYSSVEDLYRWDQALYSEKLLPKKYLDLLFTPYFPAWGGHYGYGWSLGMQPLGDSDEERYTIHHDGVINGFSSLIYRIPSEKVCIILLNNQGPAPLYEMARAITGILYNQPYSLPKKPLANSLSALLKKDGIEEARVFYEKSKTTAAYSLDENEINLLGYELLEQGKKQEAAFIFHLNLQAFPQSFNVYDSYGEVLLALGDTLSAIDHYLQSLDLNPDNKNGLRVLQQLKVDTREWKLEKEGLLEAPDEWRREKYRFPIPFAPDIPHKGIEDVRFPKDWSEAESEFFWSYVFAWRIQTAQKVSSESLESDLEAYFNGLMKVVNKDRKAVPLKASALLQEEKHTGKEIYYEGSINIYDAFFSYQALKLNLKVKHYPSPQEGKTTLLFYFSPRGFEEPVWGKLEKIGLRKTGTGY
jgi:CubicO group peptidase (beta-lactamase class C family)